MQSAEDRRRPAKAVSSTLTGQGPRSLGELLASAGPEAVEAFLDALDANAVAALPWLFECWALPHQLPPGGDWRTWVILGGRGAGKTRAGAEWVRSMVEGARPRDPGRARRVALVGETLDQARDVMVFGESGILASTPPDRMPRWEASRRRLVWPNGAEAQVFSAREPESLRGPQFDAAWSDELAKWRRAEEAWDMLQFALRLGDAPRQIVTTTPRNVGVLRRLLALPSTVSTHAPTEANRVWLAPGFIDEMRARYGGTRLARQELDGEFLEEAEGALWTWATIERARRAEPVVEPDRVVVAVDPPATGSERADLCGIVVAGAALDGEPSKWRAAVLEDCSIERASPAAWARAAVEAYHRHRADRLVAEVNQGGDMVEAVIRQIDPTVAFRAVRASRGKSARAEPVAALYEQGRVAHAAGLDRLEEQLCQMTPAGFVGRGSPDRVDALVWAMTELVLDPARRAGRPQLRAL